MSVLPHVFALLTCCRDRREDPFRLAGYHPLNRVVKLEALPSVEFISQAMTVNTVSAGRIGSDYVPFIIPVTDRPETLEPLDCCSSGKLVAVLYLPNRMNQKPIGLLPTRRRVVKIDLPGRTVLVNAVSEEKIIANQGKQGCLALLFRQLGKPNPEPTNIEAPFGRVLDPTK